MNVDAAGVLDQFIEGRATQNVEPACPAGLSDKDMRGIVRMGVVEDRRCGILARKSDGGSTEPRCELQSFGDHLAFCFVATQFA